MVESSMHRDRANVLLDAIDAGYSVGFSGKEGMLVFNRESTGVYRFYEGNDLGERRLAFENRDAALRFLDNESTATFELGFETYLCAEGQAALAAGEHERGVELLETALRWGYDVAHAGLAWAHRERPDAARVHLQQLDELFAERPYHYGRFGPLDRYLERAQSRIFDAPRYRQAVEFYSTMLELMPGRADALYGRAFGLRMLRQHADALGDYVAALEGPRPLGSGSVRKLAWLGRVSCLRSLADDDGAREAARAGLDEGEDMMMRQALDKLTPHQA